MAAAATTTTLRDAPELEALRSYQRALNTAEEPAMVNPLVERELYECAVKRCFDEAEAGVQAGLQLLREMEDRGADFLPRLDTYTRAVQACSRTGRWKTALRTFDTASSLILAQLQRQRDERLAAAAEGEEGDGGAKEGTGEEERDDEETTIVLDDSPMAGATTVHVQAAIVDDDLSDVSAEAARFWTQSEQRAFQELWVAALEACGNGAQWEKAIELLERMDDEICPEKGVVRSAQSKTTLMGGSLVEPSPAAFVHAIRACEKAGQWRRALAILTLAREKGQLARSVLPFNLVMGSLAKGGQWREACAILTELESAADSKVRVQHRRESGFMVRSHPAIQPSSHPASQPASQPASHFTCTV